MPIIKKSIITIIIILFVDKMHKSTFIESIGAYGLISLREDYLSLTIKQAYSQKTRYIDPMVGGQC